MIPGSGIEENRMMIQINTLESLTRLEPSPGDTRIIFFQVNIVIEQQAVHEKQVMGLIPPHRLGLGEHPLFFLGIEGHMGQEPNQGEKSTKREENLSKETEAIGLFSDHHARQREGRVGCSLTLIFHCGSYFSIP